jgi:hypothetical protein
MLLLNCLDNLPKKNKKKRKKIREAPSIEVEQVRSENIFPIFKFFFILFNNNNIIIIISSTNSFLFFFQFE